MLDEARNYGKLLIKRKTGSLFTIKPVLPNKSPLDVEGVDVDMTSEEIVDIIREIRHR